MPAARESMIFTPRSSKGQAQAPYFSDDEQCESKEQERDTNENSFDPQNVRVESRVPDTFSDQETTDCVHFNGQVAESTKDVANHMAGMMTQCRRLKSIAKEASDPNKNPPMPDMCQEHLELRNTISKIRDSNQAAERMWEYSSKYEIDADLCRQYEPRKQQLLKGGPIKPLDSRDAPVTVAFVTVSKKRQLFLPLCKPFICLLGGLEEKQLTHKLILDIFELFFDAAALKLSQGYRRTGGRSRRNCDGYSRFKKLKDKSWSHTAYMSLLARPYAMDFLTGVYKVCRLACKEAYFDEKMRQFKRRDKEFRKKHAAKVEKVYGQMIPAAKRLSDAIAILLADSDDEDEDEYEDEEERMQDVRSKKRREEKTNLRKRQRDARENNIDRRDGSVDIARKVVDFSPKKQRSGFCLQQMPSGNEN